MRESDAGPDSESESESGSGHRTDAGRDASNRARSGGERQTKPQSVGEWGRWFLETDEGAVAYVREILSSVAAVLLVGLLLFAISGLWPPMVAVESPSMQPNLKTGDLVFVMEEHRLAGAAAYGDTGVVTYRTGRETGYTKFGQPGDVIVYQPDGNDVQTPIIHRAMFHVNASENWYEKAVAVDPRAVGSADNCEQLDHCPAEHAGFITKGDNEQTNPHYDQVSDLSGPVRPQWVVGTAEFRIPLLGNIRLWASRTGVTPGQAGGSSGWVGAGEPTAFDSPRGVQEMGNATSQQTGNATGTGSPGPRATAAQPSASRPTGVTAG